MGAILIKEIKFMSKRNPSYLQSTQSKALRDSRNSFAGPALKKSVVEAMQRPDGGRYDVSFKSTKERPKSAYIGGSKDRFGSSKTAGPGPGAYKSTWNGSTRVNESPTKTKISSAVIGTQPRPDI